MASMQDFVQVLERSVKVDNFVLADAKIYDTTLIVLGKRTVTNNTNIPVHATVAIAYSDTTVSTWKHSVTVPEAVKSTITSGLPLIVASDKIEVSSEASYQSDWGKTLTNTEEKTFTKTITVPPMSTTTITLVTFRAHCDVPFSYKETERRCDGSIVVKSATDGVFTGVNNYPGLKTQEATMSLAECHP